LGGEKGDVMISPRTPPSAEDHRAQEYIISSLRKAFTIKTNIVTDQYAVPDKILQNSVL
jgi:hypothetical protein